MQARGNGALKTSGTQKMPERSGSVISPTPPALHLHQSENYVPGVRNLLGIGHQPDVIVAELGGAIWANIPVLLQPADG